METTTAGLTTDFKFLDRRDRLHEWETKHEFYETAIELSEALGNGDGL